MQSTPFFYSGTSNIVLPIKQSEYPSEFQGASRLTYYASLLSSLEVNSSFYKIPKPATVEKWRESVPDHFKFTFKVLKTVTHSKGLQANAEDLERFAETVAHIGDKKGCLLIQLPPSIKSDKAEELEGILESLRSDAKDWRIAVEFRDTSWYNSGTYRILQNFGACMVEQDMPKSPTPQITVVEDFHYLRFHGPEGDYRGIYDEAFLASRAKRIASLLKEGKKVYVYFNNTAGSAFENLRTLNAMVQEQTPQKR